jgi:hypothetical protein
MYNLLLPREEPLAEMTTSVIRAFFVVDLGPPGSERAQNASLHRAFLGGLSLLESAAYECSTAGKSANRIDLARVINVTKGDTHGHPFTPLLIAPLEEDNDRRLDEHDDRKGHSNLQVSNVSPLFSSIYCCSSSSLATEDPSWRCVHPSP